MDHISDTGYVLIDKKFLSPNPDKGMRWEEVSLETIYHTEYSGQAISNREQNYNSQSCVEFSYSF